MNSQNKNSWNCLGEIILALVIILITGRCLNIISPITIWKPTIQIWCSTKGNVKGDSIYITCLNQKASIFEDKGYEKRAIKTRKLILDYYNEKGDSTSVDYALAKMNFYFSGNGFEKYCTEIQDVKDILWSSWKKGLLSDDEKEMLFYSIIMLTNDVTIRESKQAFIDALAVADDIKTSKHKSMLQQQALCTLVGICMTDIMLWEEAQKYIDRIDPNSCTEDLMREECWIYKARYQLCLHNVILAQQYLDSAKNIDCHIQEVVVHVTDLQRAIYLASGDMSRAIEEQRHIVALQYGLTHNDKLERSLRQYENAILRHRQWQAKWYQISAGNEIEDFIEIYNNLDSITSPMRLSYNKLFIGFQLLNVKYCLAFNKHLGSIQNLLNDIESTPNILPEQQLQVIGLRTQATLRFPSDSTNIILQNCVDALQKRLQNTFPHFTDGEKASFWTAEEPILRQIYTANGSADVKYNIALLSKGLLLNSSNNVRRSILESGDSALIRDWKQLQMLRQAEILNLETSDIDMNSIQYRAEKLERSITQRSAEYLHFCNTWDYSWRDVQNQLKDDQCAIEYIVYPSDKMDLAKKTYAALLLRKQDSIPLFIPLCNEETLLSAQGRYSYETTQLEKLIWAPLKSYLPSGEIYVSMDGVMHHINLEAIEVDSNGTFLSDIYNIVRVSSTRDIVQLEKTVKTTYKNATLFGGIQYDKIEQNYCSSDGETRGPIFTTIRNKKVKVFNVLPYTLSEVNKIDTILTNIGSTNNVFIKMGATESSFKDLNGKSTQIVHLATHGEFSSDTEGDPMRRCYLIMAGANDFFAHKENYASNIEDGVLTAAEISALDLRGTDLVVLSACQTAQGDITPDGVFGLQRAFKQAGAQTIVMSLWQVNEKATESFMVNFYQNMASGLNKREAFHQARHKLHKEYNEVDWSAFILLD